MPNLSLGEILLILVVALVVFGPRKLPELGKTIGQAIGQFKRASEEFKRAWEDEVESEKERDKTTQTAIQTPKVETISEPATSAPAEQKQAEHWM